MEKLKNAVLGLLLVLTLVIMFAVCNDVEYKTKGTVKHVNAYTTVFEDFRGCEWELENDNNNFYVGQKVTLIFNNNKTERDVTDDFVIEARG